MPATEAPSININNCGGGWLPPHWSTGTFRRYPSCGQWEVDAAREGPELGGAAKCTAGRVWSSVCVGVRMQGTWPGWGSGVPRAGVDEGGAHSWCGHVVLRRKRGTDQPPSMLRSPGFIEANLWAWGPFLGGLQLPVWVCHPGGTCDPSVKPLPYHGAQKARVGSCWPPGGSSALPGTWPWASPFTSVKGPAPQPPSWS